MLRVGRLVGEPLKEIRHEIHNSHRSASGTHDHATLLTNRSTPLGTYPHHGAIVSTWLKPKLNPRVSLDPITLL